MDLVVRFFRLKGEEETRQNMKTSFLTLNRFHER